MFQLIFRLHFKLLETIIKSLTTLKNRLTFSISRLRAIEPFFFCEIFPLLFPLFYFNTSSNWPIFTLKYFRFFYFVSINYARKLILSADLLENMKRRLNPFVKEICFSFQYEHVTNHKSQTNR